MTPAGPAASDYFLLGFPLSDEAWDRYDVAANLAAADAEPARAIRRLVVTLATALAGTMTVAAEELLALRTLNGILRWVTRRYFEVENPGSLDRGRRQAATRLGDEGTARLFEAFVSLFPPAQVRPGGASPRAFLAERGAGRGPDPATVEMLLLYLNTTNPAAAPALPLFDDGELRRRAGYMAFVTDFEQYLEEHEPPGSTGLSLFALLRAPLHASPHSLGGQLRWILENWADFLPQEMLRGLQLALDVLAEMDVRRGGPPGPPPVLEFGPGSPGWTEHGPEPEAFSADADWMSNVVLMAKSVYVWLDQLARWHGRPVRTLAEIPDAELDRLARWGINGLWLIGLWERSTASRTIKQWMGNPEAAASAYALKRTGFSRRGCPAPAGCG